MEIKQTSIPEIKKNYCTREIDKEVIFFEESGVEIHTTDKVGFFIYKQIDGKKSVGEIITLICNEYDVEVKTAQSDTIDFLTELYKNKIININ